MTPGLFRLLEPVADAGPVPGSIELGGIRWSIHEYAGVPAGDEAPPYTCISYAWGSGRVANPFDPARPMSDRAIVAAEAAIQALHPPAIWLDAFCVPAEGPARAQCLQNLGAIYAAATQVAVVLSKPCCASLERIRTGGRLDPASLLEFERDEWVTRAWNYQEIANSKVTQFIGEGGRDAIDGGQLLNSLGHAIAEFQKSQGITAFEFRQRYPNINDLEDTLADYMISNYLQRFALQVMAAMDPRRAEHADDHFDAMIGALPEMSSYYQLDKELPPVERFMRSCEARKDFSFIYCIAPRSIVPGRRWRPESNEIPTVLSWHTYGEGQSGVLFPTHLQLDNMCRMNAGVIDPDATRMLLWWAEFGAARTTPGDLASAVLERLRRIGFSGCGEHIELESGYFFPQAARVQGFDSFVVVPAGVRWAHGGPGLLLAADGSGANRFLDVGVFTGRVPKSGDAIGVA